MNKKYTILLGLIIVFLVSWVIYEIYDTIRVTEEARQSNEEWAENYKYPWRTMELNTPEDVQIGNMRISSSDFSDDEKNKEMGKLWERYNNTHRMQDY